MTIQAMGVDSLRAVNDWLSVINSNFSGSQRVAYKSTKLSFGDSVSAIKRQPLAQLNGIQLPGPSITVDHTSIDFAQGTVINDGINSHLAIRGEGFFTTIDRNGKIIFTRDGSFRFVQSETAPLYGFSGYNLVNDQGLYLADLTTYEEFGVTSGYGVPSITIYLIPEQNKKSFNFWTGSNAGLNPFSVPLNSTAYGGEWMDLSTNNPFDTATTLSGFVDNPAPSFDIALIPNKQELKFSKYGATTFEYAALNTPASIEVFASNNNHFASADSAAPGTIIGTEVVHQALETSNATLNEALPELSLAQKLFSAVSKIVSVFNSNLDITINLIR